MESADSKLSTTASAHDGVLPLVLTMNTDPHVPMMIASTLMWSRLIVVHSAAGKDAAGRLAKYLRQRFPDAEPALLLKMDDTEDPISVGKRLEKLDEAPFNLTAPYRLDYTAGTREQMIAAVWKHLDDHVDIDDSHQLRSYLDNYTGKLLADGDSTGSKSMSVLTNNVSMADIVETKGFRWESDRTSTVRVRVGKESELRDALEQMAWKFRNANFGKRIKRLDNLVKKVESCLAGIKQNLERGAEESNYNGSAFELFVLGSLALGLGSAGSDTELVMGVKVLPGPELDYKSKTGDKLIPNRNVICEFDILLRVKQRIYAIEVKAGVEKALEVISERETMSRVFFGHEAKTALVTCPNTGDSAQEIARIVTDANSIVPTRQPMHTFIFEGKDTVAELEGYAKRCIATVNSGLEPTSYEKQRAEEEAPAIGVKDDEGFLFCGLGNRPGVVLTAASMHGVPTCAFTTVGNEQKDIAGLVGQYIHWETTNQMSENAAYEVACKVSPKIVGTSVGPKSACAGLIRYVWERANHEIAHIVRADSVHGPRVFRGNPVDGWKKEPIKQGVPWPKLFEGKGFDRVKPDDPGWGEFSRFFLEKVAEAESRNCEEFDVWVERNYRTHPYLNQFIVTTPDATCSVSVIGEPAIDGSSAGRVNSVKMKKLQESILDFELEAESIVGPANGHLVVTVNGSLLGPDDGGQQAIESLWHLIAQQNDWTNRLSVNMKFRGFEKFIPDNVFKWVS